MVTFVLFLFGMMILGRMLSYLDAYFAHRIDGWYLLGTMLVNFSIFVLILCALFSDF